MTARLLRDLAEEKLVARDRVDPISGHAKRQRLEDIAASYRHAAEITEALAAELDELAGVLLRETAPVTVGRRQGLHEAARMVRGEPA